MIDHQRKIVFVHIPRTGGTSIEAAFGVGEKEAGVLEDGLPKHASASEIRERLPADWGDYFSFSVVRNPWDRVISLFHQPFFRSINSIGGHSLAHFLEHYEPAPWEHRTMCRYLDLDIDFLGRFESLPETFAQIERACGVSIPTGERLRSTNRPRSGYRSFFDARTREMVAEMFAEDIKRFGYEF